MITETRKTSTITIHHDSCDVSKWTISDWQTLASFVKHANLQQAAALSRLGMQLVLSEHHEPAGGTLEQMGYGEEDQMPDPSITDDLAEIADELDITPIVPIYRGPTKYAVLWRKRHRVVVMTRGGCSYSGSPALRVQPGGEAFLCNRFLSGFAVLVRLALPQRTCLLSSQITGCSQ